MLHLRSRSSRRRRHVGLAVAGALAVVLVACEDTNTTKRSDEPVVLTGADLPSLLGATPGRIVAFAHSRPDGRSTWTQIPVQVDQRKVIDYGEKPPTNGQAGVPGTVYGSGVPSGVTDLQYADPNTWVGADPDATFDRNDELVFMASDGGGLVRDGEETRPAGTTGAGVAVRFTDPTATDQRGWAYLFRSTNLSPGAGKDYVRYQFRLTSGAYKPTYKRADGPNPETSTASTASYRLSFGDRWDDATWRIDAGAATGVDVLDGYKDESADGTCGRSNRTFQDAEGAFVANIDGPVRAIRSIIGANSGPKTQRTNFMYRNHQDIVTNLRVHPLPGIRDYLDLSQAARGMTYRSSTVGRAVTVDGSQDAVGTASPVWELYTGPQGSFVSTFRLDTDFSPPYPASGRGFPFQYVDRNDAPIRHCWGDDDLLGSSGPTALNIPSTDPEDQAFGTMTVSRLISYRAPGATVADALSVAASVDKPLTVTVAPYQP